MKNILGTRNIFFNYLIGLSLVILAVWELRFEIRILTEHFTITAFIFALSSHPFAIFSLVLGGLILKRNLKPN